MVIRQLRSEEFDASMNLSEYAFQYKLPSEKEQVLRKDSSLNRYGVLLRTEHWKLN